MSSLTFFEFDLWCCRLQTQHEPESSALASAGQQGNTAELGQDVAALQGWLQRVAPQLDELAGLKQQMGRLISILQPGNTASWLITDTAYCVLWLQGYHSTA